jgi:hypothetical protein
MYCGNKLEEDSKFCPQCGSSIKQESAQMQQTHATQPGQQLKRADPDNPYEIDNPNASKQVDQPPIGTATHGDDDVGLAVGAAMMLGWGLGHRRIYRRRRRRAFFY